LIPLQLRARQSLLSLCRGAPPGRTRSLAHDCYYPRHPHAGACRCNGRRRRASLSGLRDGNALPVTGRRSNTLCHIAARPQAGRATMLLNGPSLVVEPSRISSRKPLTASGDGFSLNCAVACEVNERAKLEWVCRYMARGPIAQERLSVDGDGLVVLELKRAFSDGTTHVSLIVNGRPAPTPEQPTPAHSHQCLFASPTTTLPSSANGPLFFHLLTRSGGDIVDGQILSFQHHRALCSTYRRPRCYWMFVLTLVNPAPSSCT
jgi:hypothetical protein